MTEPRTIPPTGPGSFRSSNPTDPIENLERHPADDTWIGPPARPRGLARLLTAVADFAIVVTSAMVTIDLVRAVHRSRELHRATLEQLELQREEAFSQLGQVRDEIVRILAQGLRADAQRATTSAAPPAPPGGRKVRDDPRA